MDLLTRGGWSALLMIAAIVAWSAVMLLLAYLVNKGWRPRGQVGRTLRS